MKGIVLMVVAGTAAIAGVLVGVLPIQVYDQGEWLSCGPALLDAGGRFAGLACAEVARPVQTLSVMLLVAAAITIGYGILALRTTPEQTVQSRRLPAI